MTTVVLTSDIKNTLTMSNNQRNVYKKKYSSLQLFTSSEFYTFIHLLICLSSCLSICLSAPLSIHHSLSKQKKKHRLSSIVVASNCLQSVWNAFWNELFVLDVIKSEWKIRHRCLFRYKCVGIGNANLKDSNDEIQLVWTWINERKYASEAWSEWRYNYPKIIEIQKVKKNDKMLICRITA